MMENNKTIYPFLVLIFASWIMELVMGWKVIGWWWGTAWYAWDAPGSESMADELVSLGQTLSSARSGAQMVSVHATSAGVVGVVFALFVGLHVLHAIWNGLLRPARKRWSLGVRPPTHRENKRFETAYATIARNAVELVGRPRKWLVVDGPGLDMRWHGYILVIDRELLWHRCFVPLLAHQLGHANSEDRLGHRLYEMLPPTSLMVGAVCGWPFSFGHVLTYPFWMWYWRTRVYAADAFAVEVGQGYNLARALSEVYLRVDIATPGGRLLKPMPFVAQRIDRIGRLLEQRPPGARRVIS